MSQSENILSDDEYCGVEPMKTTRPPSRAGSVTSSTEAERSRIIRRKKKTLNDRLEEISNFSIKCENENDANVLIQQGLILLHRLAIVINNHD
jgi:hypothetical protein